MVTDEDEQRTAEPGHQGLYPPGSTFKILTSLSYIRENPDTYSQFSFNCQGSLSREDVTITCYNGEVHGQEDLKASFAHSCNTAFAQIGLDMDGMISGRRRRIFCLTHRSPRICSTARAYLSWTAIPPTESR